MPGLEVRIKEARRDILRQAAQRWTERAEAREQGSAAIAKFGIGAADTPKRVQENLVRESLMGGMKIFRHIGANDLVNGAPDALAGKAALPVARIATLPGMDGIVQGYATGFIIPGDLFMTNHHVFQTRSDVAGYCANFKHEELFGQISEGIYFEFDPARFFLSDAEYDIAIVAIKPVGLGGERLDSLGRVQLIEATGKVRTGEALNIIQHPHGGPRQFGIKNNRLLDILPGGFLHYETDTEQGSSGSPVSNKHWELVGVHHCGVPSMRNGRILKPNGDVWDEENEDESVIHWIANEGSRVSSIIGRLRTMTAASVAEQAILASLLGSTADPVANAQQETAPSAQPITLPLQAAASIFSNATFSGPVTINIYNTPAPQAPSATDPAPPATRSAQFDEAALIFDPRYAKREGYDPMFLGIEVPLPQLDAEKTAQIYSVADYKEYYDGYRNVPKVPLGDSGDSDPLILHYHHYSLAFNKAFKMCHWTASNCDYSDLQRQDSRNRGELGSEKWEFDPRVPRDLQLGDSAVYKPLKRIDRGHIVRREDNAWGAEGLETDYANSDTFHWTNCTPQHEAFNKETPADGNKKKTGVSVYAGTGIKGIWGHFEAQLQEALRNNGGQATIFSGPVLSDNLPETDWGKGPVSIPTKFWKVVVVPASTAKPITLEVYGYLFNQAPTIKKFGLTYEGLEMPGFERQRVPLARISELTGVLFPDELLQAEMSED